MKWTENQEKAIFAKPAEIVVSAAAGSGKTQILTTRIIERLKQSDNPVSIEKLLIVTFTKAAAAEMRERIGKALKNAVKAESDASLRKHLKKQLTLLGSAHICTIDSFCYDIVKQNFFTVDFIQQLINSLHSAGATCGGNYYARSHFYLPLLLF